MISIPSKSDLEGMSKAALAGVYNRLVAEFPKKGRPSTVVRFESRERGVVRTLKLAAELAAVPPPPAPKEPVPAPRRPRKRRGTHISPLGGGTPKSCLVGSRQATLVDLLRRPDGATMPELLAALAGGKKPWTEHNIRSAFGWDMRLHGYGVESRGYEGDGVERFYLVVPPGQEIPEHRPRKT